MSDNELKEVIGGTDMSASFLSALVKGITGLYEIGRRVGSYLIRYLKKSPCSVD